MAKKKDSIGWAYNKQGQIVNVNSPIYANGRKVKNNKETVAGALHASVGFPSQLIGKS